MSQPSEKSHAGDSLNHAAGTSREYPETEEAPLQEELLFHEKGTEFGRVLSCFEFRINGKPVVVRPDAIAKDGSSDLEVIGITGTIYNKEGLFAQCGWFGNRDLDWFWVCTRDITALIVDQNILFWGGQPCIWLHTKLGKYALLLPHSSYREKWEETAAALGENGLSALFRQWPACGPRPSWWDDRWKDDWPFENEAGSKRRASTELERYESQARENQQLPCKWIRLGSRGEQGNQGQMRTNLNQRERWDLAPRGLVATCSAADVGPEDGRSGVKAVGVSRRWKKSSRS